MAVGNTIEEMLMVNSEMPRNTRLDRVDKLLDLVGLEKLHAKSSLLNATLFLNPCRCINIAS